jgi:CubicO group peptidase (beta-lactamase class C family)
MKINNIFSHTLILILAVAFVMACNAQSNSNSTNSNSISSNETKAEKIDELVSTYSDYGEFNGSVLVATEGEVIFKKGFGFANMEWDIPNETDTKFRLASVTKQFTAMLILQLASENKLKLHEPIATYLPDYPKKNGKRITVHHLLTHTSGTPRIADFVREKDIERDNYKPSDLLKIFSEGALDFTPGERFAYSNEGYIILGAIIEEITGLSYEKVLQNRILTPLEMVNTGYDHNRNLLKNRASGYSKAFDGEFVNTSYIDMSFPYAAGSMYSTVEDLFLWDQALYTEKLLPKKYRDLIFKIHTSARDEAYGYGWFIGDVAVGNTNDYVQANAHGGGIYGFNTRITRIQSNKSLIVLLNNTDSAPLREMTVGINGILNDKPYDFPKKSVANSLFEVIDTEGIEEGITFFNAVKDDNAYYHDENEMNVASYKFMQSNRLEAAAEVLRLAIVAFPNAFNLYDSYGQILLSLGEKEKAIENYKKSVELNPNNQNGIRVLNELGVE